MIELTREELQLRSYVLLKNCEKVLDLGCGIGSFIELFKEQNEKVTGYDWNNESVTICKNLGYNVFKRDICELKPNIEPSSYDGINCSHVLEHMVPEDAHKLLLNIDYMLKPGGLVVIQTPMMHEHFWNDFSHIKPYVPNALRHYFISNNKQRTFSSLKYTYVEEEFIWRIGKDAYLIAFRKQ